MEVQHKTISVFAGVAGLELGLRESSPWLIEHLQSSYYYSVFGLGCTAIRCCETIDYAAGSASNLSSIPVKEAAESV